MIPVPRPDKYVFGARYDQDGDEVAGSDAAMMLDEFHAAFGEARWVVFVCADQGHPMKVGYEPDEYIEDRCPCGAALIAVPVMPVEGNAQVGAPGRRGDA